MTADCLAGERRFGVVLIARGSEVGGGDQRVDVGTVAHIETATPFRDGRWALLVRGTHRIRITTWLPDDPYPQAVFEDLVDPPSTGIDDLVARAESSLRRTLALLSELGNASAMPQGLDLGKEADVRAWRLCALAPVNPVDRQQLLETADPTQRMTVLIDLCDAVASDVERLLSAGSSGQP
jgi:Lon protease-like protein